MHLCRDSSALTRTTLNFLVRIADNEGGGEAKSYDCECEDEGEEGHIAVEWQPCAFYPVKTPTWWHVRFTSQMSARDNGLRWRHVVVPFEHGSRRVDTTAKPDYVGSRRVVER